MTSHFWRFCIVGSFGFFIDAGLVEFLQRIFNWNPYIARFISFGAATSFTWLANRTYTFAVINRPHWQEWVLYASLMLIGATANYTVFFVTLTNWPVARDWPSLGVATGTITALLINYTSMRWLFSQR